LFVLTKLLTVLLLLFSTSAIGATTSWYGRAIDLSRAANKRISCGLCKVTIKVLK